jgi:hypothetical protein
VIFIRKYAPLHSSPPWLPATCKGHNIDSSPKASVHCTGAFLRLGDTPATELSQFVERFYFHAILDNLFVGGSGASAPINIGLRGLLTIRERLKPL